MKLEARLGFALVLCLGAGARANVAFTGSYTQDFNGMALGTSVPANWFVGGRSGTDGLVDATGNGAITGTSVQVDNGSVAAGSGTIGNYNYGATGDAASRSLGSIATTALGHRAMEIRVDNNTGFEIGSFEIRYDGRQWRLENAANQTLVMKYSTDGVNFVNMGSVFDFNSIQDSGTAGPLDGNTVRLNGIGGVYTPPGPIPINGTFYLRWFDFNDNGVADHALAIDNIVLNNPVSSGGTVLTFQDGSGGYDSTVDTFLQVALPTANNAAAQIIEWDGEDGGSVNSLLIRFEQVFGTNPGQIKPTDVITSASLAFTVINVGNAGSLHEVLTGWSDSDTFNTFGGEPDVQADEYGPSVGSVSGSALGVTMVDVSASIAAWKTAPNPAAANLGWIIRPTGTDGIEVRSSEYTTAVLERPKLVVIVNGGTPSQKTLQVKHQPYLQLGDAPLVSTGSGIGTTDQIVIVWQTVEAGSGSAPNDYFEVEYRAVGAGSYTPAGPVTPLNTGDGTRVNRSVTIAGLPYDSDFEYRVHHRRNPSSPVLVTTYNGTFHTRKHPSNNASFTFAAHGDSATIHNASELAKFETVNARMAAINPVFVMLLGDNIYDVGTHFELDARFDATVVPINSALIRNRIEYFCMGNHDAGTNNGLPSLQNYYCPMPVLGLTSPVAAPVGETPEKNFSFDYGMLHISVIDSTAWGGPGNSVARANAITAWLDADLAAHSAAPWKIVAAHHPPKSNFGHTDTGAGMAAQLVPVLANRGVDLLLVGHSHNYQRSFPLTGYSGGDVTYDIDTSGSYTKGARVIEVVAGTGGRNIDCCAPTTATAWLAKAFGSNNGGEVGPFIIDVSPTQLVCKYTAADDGAIKDQFTINVPGPTIAVNPPSVAVTAFLGSSPPNGSFSVSNSGTGTITYSITTDVPWLSVAPDNGSSTGEADPIDLIYSTGALPVGVHSGTVIIAAPEALNNPKTLPVTVTVESVKPDFDGDGDVDQGDFAFLQNCLTGIVAAATGDCLRADIDASMDDRVEVADLDVFLNCHSGANVLANPNCD